MSYCSCSVFFLQKITVVTIYALFVLPSLALAQEEMHILDSYWQYRWGDSELDVAGFPKWVAEGIEQKQWNSIDFPSNPPNREGQKTFGVEPFSLMIFGVILFSIFLALT